MSKTVISLCVAIMVAVLLTGCNNNQPVAPTEKPVANGETAVSPVNAGRQIFEDKCVACHGEDGTAAIAGAANLKTLNADSLTIIETISKGKNGMPAFGSILSAIEVEQVAAYVKTLHP